MTNKEYIENLSTFINHFKDEIEYNGYGDKIFDTEQAKKDIETFEAAIKALEFYDKAEVVISQLRADRDRLLAEQSEDAVSREAVLKLKHHKPEYGDMIYAFDVEQLPSVQPKRQTGKWIEKDYYLYECSECGQYIYSETEHDLLEFHAFCGRCGARMESEE